MSKDHALTHSENRFKVCLFCFKKKKAMFPIKDKLKLVVLSLFADYDVEEKSLPVALCSSCKIKIYKAKHGSGRMELKLPILSDDEKQKRATRSQDVTKCSCKLCQIARAVPANIAQATHDFITEQHKKEMVVSSSVEKRCSVCCTILARGKQHVCNKVSLVQNISGYLSALDEKSQSQVISSALKRKVSDTGLSDLSLVQSHGGQPLKIKVGGKENCINAPNQSLISANDIQSIQTNLNLSYRKKIEIASVIRSASKNKTIIESGYKAKLERNTHLADGFFTYKEFKFVKHKTSISSDDPEVVVYCTDVKSFIDFIKQRRNIKNTHLKLGIDGGGGFLKICLSIQEISNNGCETASSKSVIAYKQFKDTGVKKVFILAISQSTQENYENVCVWSALNISTFDETIATDLKLANILVGIMSHSSSYPCTWCYARSDELETCGELRTTKNILENYENWIKSGTIKNNAKFYKNCNNPPLFSCAQETPVLQIIPPPELHLMLGVVNTLFGHMMKEFEAESLAWAKACHAQREVTHGGHGFKGNSCRRLLSNVDVLRAKKKLGLLKYVKAFEDFNEVVKACFGNNLDENFATYINIFKQSFLDLDIKITPKVHAVFYHITQFCKENNMALGFFSEQAMESIHFDFKAT
ncbi:unnamed protein product [Brassicogethes aeneus]|uniref:Uncharacterized protein n=1 Tax=Brassicogethes aeneus TaxID=1431903 RepID=A0A9P0ASU1_BRAAE|nr:unnamed protein product [Brassicogethes aeneus]